ncbi:hypothetical protein [Pseudomonas sp. Irchel s3h9]|uniref:hypothetical protein n=1 Tax=Pseudomonas sp. Irchel s3h9 TaxID=2009192 RepID=UPI000BA30D20|nr:hypothetical protein [Pseudomonas sp. Irchel s3h9]
MERSTALRKVKRSLWGEFNYRLNWIIFGTIGAILLCFIPVLGWLLALGLVLAILYKTFGFRETFLQGNCPACTKTLPVDPKADVFACPVCGSCMAVREDSLVLIKID